jgi:hypothetical protein
LFSSFISFINSKSQQCITLIIIVPKEDKKTKGSRVSLYSVEGTALHFAVMFKNMYLSTAQKGAETCTQFY